MPLQTCFFLKSQKEAEKRNNTEFRRPWWSCWWRSWRLWWGNTLCLCKSVYFLHDCLEEFMQSLPLQCDRWNLITVFYVPDPVSPITITGNDEGVTVHWPVFHWPQQLQWNLITAALRVKTMLFAAFFNVFMAMGVIHGNNLQIMQLTHSTYTHFICDKKCLCSRWDISTVVKEEMLAFTRAILYKFTNYTIYRKCPFENKYFELKNLWGANGAPQTWTTY